MQVFCPLCQFANTFWGLTTEDGHIIEHYGCRCQGWELDEQHKKQQCEFRFRFKQCPYCGEENDIAARRCHQCDAILSDPDDMLKAALKLKDALILRCGGMQLASGEDAKGEWIKITYYDEDGSDVSERFRLKTPLNVKHLNIIFYVSINGHPLHHLSGNTLRILFASKFYCAIPILSSPVKKIIFGKLEKNI